MFNMFQALDYQLVLLAVDQVLTIYLKHVLGHVKKKNLFSVITGYKDKFRPLEQYKVVIDGSNLPFSFGQYLVHGTYNQEAPPLQIFQHFIHVPDSRENADIRYHIFEVKNDDVSFLHKTQGFHSSLKPLKSLELILAP